MCATRWHITNRCSVRRVSQQHITEQWLCSIGTLLSKDGCGQQQADKGWLPTAYVFCYTYIESLSVGA